MLREEGPRESRGGADLHSLHALRLRSQCIWFDNLYVASTALRNQGSDVMPLQWY
jgi:hypothetical protein